MFLEECEKHNVTPAQFAVLTVLYYQGTLDQVSISSQIGFDRNTVAVVIRRLERRGLITRPVKYHGQKGQTREDNRIRQKFCRCRSAKYDKGTKAFGWAVERQGICYPDETTRQAFIRKQ